MRGYELHAERVADALAQCVRSIPPSDPDEMAIALQARDVIVTEARGRIWEYFGRWRPAFSEVEQAADLVNLVPESNLAKAVAALPTSSIEDRMAPTELLARRTSGPAAGLLLVAAREMVLANAELLGSDPSPSSRRVLLDDTARVVEAVAVIDGLLGADQLAARIGHVPIDPVIARRLASFAQQLPFPNGFSYLTRTADVERSAAWVESNPVLVRDPWDVVAGVERLGALVRAHSSETVHFGPRGAIASALTLRLLLGRAAAALQALEEPVDVRTIDRLGDLHSHFTGAIRTLRTVVDEDTISRRPTPPLIWEQIRQLQRVDSQMIGAMGPVRLRILAAQCLDVAPLWADVVAGELRRDGTFAARLVGWKGQPLASLTVTDLARAQHNVARFLAPSALPGAVERITGFTSYHVVRGQSIVLAHMVERLDALAEQEATNPVIKLRSAAIQMQENLQPAVLGARAYRFDGDDRPPSRAVGQQVEVTRIVDHMGRLDEDAIGELLEATRQVIQVWATAVHREATRPDSTMTAFVSDPTRVELRMVPTPPPDTGPYLNAVRALRPRALPMVQGLTSGQHQALIEALVPISPDLGSPCETSELGIGTGGRDGLVQALRHCDTWETATVKPGTAVEDLRSALVAEMVTTRARGGVGHGL